MTNIELQTLTALKSAAVEYTDRKARNKEIRAELAGLAAQGILASGYFAPVEDIATKAVAIADAIINRLKED